jgi:hypothetical protein
MEVIGMTNSQKKALEMIKALVISEFYSDQWEIKKFEITDCGSFLSVIIETGRINDEGTMAQIFARDYAHLFIGKRGAITYPVTENGKWKKKKFHGYTMLEAVCAQRKQYE